MNLKKLLLPGIAGGIAYFFLGYLFYGVLFANEMVSPVVGVNRPMDQMIWWSLILGSLLYGVLVAFVLGKANINSVASGFITSAMLGLLASASYDFTMYANTNLFTLKTVIYDIGISTIMVAITGILVAFVRGLVSK